jgi:hypothetical protein
MTKPGNNTYSLDRYKGRLYSTLGLLREVDGDAPFVYIINL